MDYEQFKDEVLKRINEFVPAKYQDKVTEVTPTSAEDGAERISITIQDGCKKMRVRHRVEDLYRQYCKLDDWGGMAATCVEQVERMLDAVFSLDNPFDNDFARKNVYVRLVGSNRYTKEELERVPHRMLCDLVVDYRIRLVSDGYSLFSAVLSNTQAQDLGMDEEQLFSLALKNTMEQTPPLIGSANTMLEEVTKKPVDSRFEVYYITNSEQAYGAASVLCGDTLEVVAEKVNDNLYLLPSSVHEFLAVSATEHSIEGLKETVKTVNGTLEADEFLSDNVYFYDRETKAITIA